MEAIMSAALTSLKSDTCGTRTTAAAWFDAHQEETRSRAAACFSRYSPQFREEAIAETMALTFRWAEPRDQ